MFNDDDVLKPLPQTRQTCGFSPETIQKNPQFSFSRNVYSSRKNLYLPVCVRMCRFNNDGLSKAFEQTPHGNNARSRGLALGVGPTDVGSVISPCDDAAELAELSPLTLLCSSSVVDGGELDNPRDNNDIDRSRGESAIKEKQEFDNNYYLCFVFNDFIMCLFLIYHR